MDSIPSSVVPGQFWPVDRFKPSNSVLNGSNLFDIFLLNMPSKSELFKILMDGSDRSTDKNWLLAIGCDPIPHDYGENYPNLRGYSNFSQWLQVNNASLPNDKSKNFHNFAVLR